MRCAQALVLSLSGDRNVRPVCSVPSRGGECRVLVSHLVPPAPPGPLPPRTCQYGLLPWGVCFEQRQATRGRLGLPVHSALRLVPCQLGVQRTAWTKAHSLQKIGAAFRLPPTSRAAFVDGRLITLVESVKR